MTDELLPPDSKNPGRPPDSAPEGPASPRISGWQPRDASLSGLRGGGASDSTAEATPDAPEAATRAPRPADATPPPYRPYVGRLQRTPAAAVAGDVVLSADVATSDLSVSSSARLGGRAIALAGLVVVGGVVLSRLIGWLRTAVYLAEFGGHSNSLDAFIAAFRIPDTVFQLVAAGAVGSALVPVASALLAQGEEDRARRLISTIGNLMVLALIPLAVVVWIAAPAIVPFLLNPKPDQLELEIGMTRLMLLSPMLLAVGAVMTAGLNSLGIFGAPAMAPNVYNIAIVVCAIVLTPFLGVYALAIGVVVGASGHVLIQMRPVQQARLWSPHVHLNDPAVRETLKLMAPRALGLGATQLVFLVTTFFAATLPIGAQSAYFSTFTALQIPVGLIGVPLGIVLLPPLSRAVAQRDDERFRRLVDQSVRLLLFVVVPLTGFMLVLATPTIAFLYQHGSFSANDTALYTPIYEVFLLGLVAHVLIALLAPIFYAGKDTRTPVTAALLAVVVDIAAAVALFPFFHLEGLALAIGLGAWAEVVLLVILMERRVGFDLRPMARHAVAFVGGAIVASAAALLAYRFIEGATSSGPQILAQLLELAVGGLVGLGVYLAWARVFRLPELWAALALAKTLRGGRK
ncbi:MAG TPA: murein biosynthesis integral membrane protein MurJ, partial [Candidatus Limnocylindrales bacterium]